MITGVLDVGSNSVRLMLSEDGKTLSKRVVVTRLAEGLSADGRLKEIPMSRTLAAMGELKRAAVRAGAERLYAFATAAVRSAVNAYFDRSKQLADDPYLETREKEDAFLSRIEDTISRSLQSCTPVSLGGILQLMQSAQPAAALVSEETEEDISAALDFADGF